MNTRRKPGPKTDAPPGEDLKPVTYTVDEMTRRRLTVLGKGNESAGVRVAARVAYERYQRQTEPNE